MDEDFYFEETNNKKKYITLSIIVVILIGVGLFFYKTYIFRIKPSITLEVGDSIDTDVSFFLKNKILDKDKYKLVLDEYLVIEDNKVVKAGEFTYTVKYNNTTKKGKLIIKDTKAPQVETNDLTVGLNEEYEPDDFISICKEYSKPCDIQYAKESFAELSKNEGTYKIELKVKDLYNNETTVKTNLTVKKGYSLADTKIKDLTPVSIDPDYGDWDYKTYVVKYAKAFKREDIGNERLTYLYDMADDDLSGYLPKGYENKTIEDLDLVYVYNKYNYIVGFAYRALLTDGSHIYLTNGE